LNTLPQEIVDGKLVEIKHPTPKSAGNTAPVLQA
jgi:hypothetical protein